MSDDGPDEVDLPPDAAAAHELITALRNDGYTVGFDDSDVVDEFPEHQAHAGDLLEADDVSAFFLTVMREGQTDYSTSVLVDDPTVWGITQIQLLGAHFRTVLDALPVDTTTLVSAMVDEAVTIDEIDDD